MSKDFNPGVRAQTKVTQGSRAPSCQRPGVESAKSIILFNYKVFRLKPAHKSRALPGVP